MRADRRYDKEQRILVGQRTPSCGARHIQGYSHDRSAIEAVFVPGCTLQRYPLRMIYLFDLSCEIAGTPEGYLG